MRGYINRSEVKTFSIFGITLLAIAVLCYQGKLSIGNISSLPLFILLLLMLAANNLEIPIKTVRTKKIKSIFNNAQILEQMFSVPVLKELETRKELVFNTKLTLNLGGFVIPASMIIYLLFTQFNVAAIEIFLVMLVATVLLAELVNGVGIVVPDYIGLISVPIALILAPENVAYVIFVSSIPGILIGTVISFFTIDREKNGSAYINFGGVGSFKAVYIITLIAGLMSYFN
ncbi:DUF1614 domain-containing protein [Methanohalobium sp.]|uniref:DUF1614 domain-containing protein n=1 Tax=Methanohalobium sp. TaxID=2837493 RepID=UPI0025CF6C4B|nr:DUF1614 domain-containing protein [Methanohalobium sp.]